MVTVNSTLQGPAPRLRADISSRSSTPPMAAMTALAISGKDTSADARAAATQVKSTSTPISRYSAEPIGPSRPSSQRRKNPTATGGRASGSETRTSTMNLPGMRRFTSSQLTHSATGTLTAVPTKATCKLRVNTERSKSGYLWFRATPPPPMEAEGTRTARTPLSQRGSADGPRRARPAPSHRSLVSIRRDRRRSSRYRQARCPAP